MDANGNISILEQDAEVMNNLTAIIQTVKELDDFSNREYFYKNSIWKSQRGDRANKNLDRQNWIDNKTFDWKKLEIIEMLGLNLWKDQVIIIKNYKLYMIK